MEQLVFHQDRVLFGGDFTDVMVIYRAYKTDLMKRPYLDDEKAFGWVDKIFFCRRAN